MVGPPEPQPRPGVETATPPLRAPGDVLVHLRRARDHMDRHFAEAIDLDAVAAVAGLSKFHFHRLFRATYGCTPAHHLTRRRVERAQDLLRATNLTVTEVCFAVGYASLGSFSARFKELVGEAPRDFQRRYAASGPPRIPACFVFMWGLAERRAVGGRPAPRGTASARTAIGEKPIGDPAS
jgi:AraC-like DNA-binding protein